MKLLGAAALAAAIAFSCPAFAAECSPEKQIDHAKAVAKDALAEGKFSGLLDLTGADVAKFIQASNSQFGTRIPETGIEEILVISVQGKVVAFGFIDGCQVGYVVIPAIPVTGKTAVRPGLQPHGLRLI